MIQECNEFFRALFFQTINVTTGKCLFEITVSVLRKYYFMRILFQSPYRLKKCCQRKNEVICQKVYWKQDKPIPSVEEKSYSYWNMKFFLVFKFHLLFDKFSKKIPETWNSEIHLWISKTCSKQQCVNDNTLYNDVSVVLDWLWASGF